jgi:sugar-specific transcriptional regulator TrmB
VEAIIRELKSIGLASYESRAYASLLKHGALTPMQVAKIAKIPGPRVYDILRKLESMGFVVKEHKKREPKYSALPVKTALGRYGEELAASHRSKEMLIKKVSTKLTKTVAPTISAEPPAYTLDSDQIANWAIRTTAKKKVWGTGPLDEPISKAYPNILKPIICLKKKGIEGKFLVNVTKDNFRLLKKVAKYVEIRHWGKVPNLALYIIDGKEALLSVATPKTGTYTGCLIKHPDVIKLFEDYFTLRFKKGITLEKRAKELSKK